MRQAQVVEMSYDSLWQDTADFFEEFPIPLVEKIKHLGLFETPLTMQRTIFFDRLYQMINGITGSIWLFGLTYGRDFVLFQNLRTIYGHRDIIGWDTFSGHAGWTEVDGTDEYAQDGAFGVGGPQGPVVQSFWRHAEKLHTYIGGGDGHIVPGDVAETLPDYLETRPWELVALAYLDMDNYAPTKVALEAVWSRMPVGGVIGFDELSQQKYPGETVAVLEVLGTPKIQTFPWCSMSYVVKE